MFQESERFRTTKYKKGVEILEFSISWRKTPNLFSEFFVTKEKLTSEEAMKVLKFDHSVSEKNEEFLSRFLQDCWECKFQQFWLFVIASKQRWFQINFQRGQFK